MISTRLTTALHAADDDTLATATSTLASMGSSISPAAAAAEALLVAIADEDTTDGVDPRLVAAMLTAPRAYAVLQDELRPLVISTDGTCLASGLMAEVAVAWAHASEEGYNACHELDGGIPDAWNGA